MSETEYAPYNLVLYKQRPALITRVDKKVEIEIEGGQVLSVRPKDVLLLHDGPVHDLAELGPLEGEIETAWELLSGEKTDLAELAELVYGAYSPASAWATWQLVQDGLYFGGQPHEIVVHPPQAVAEERRMREAREAEKLAWTAFLERVKAGHYLPEDGRYLDDVEALALGLRDQSQVLRTLGHSEDPQNAHSLLLALGYWDHAHNPYPWREGITTTAPDLQLPDLLEETRRDLTNLAALAIDDEGNQDPDDAISLEDGRLWVHIADVAALITPGSPADLEAQARGANLYLPEGVVPMLPPQVTRLLGLGLAEVSPALSFGLDFDTAGEIAQLEIVPSWIRVTRLTYEEAESRIEEPLLGELHALAQKHEIRRFQNGAVHIDLPEVKVQVHDGQVTIRPLPPLQSRDLVREAMLMTGEAVARYALENNIPVPFTVQDAPDEEVPFRQPAVAMMTSPSEMFALRRMLKRGRQQSSPAPHSGLGMDLYTQATSPLRRYLDLVIHQQLRAHLRGQSVLDVQAVMERVGAADAVTGSVRRAERMSQTHWTLVYLLQHPDWKGQGVVIDRRGARALVLIPELGLETEVYPRQDLPLNSNVRLALDEVILPDLEAHFHIQA